MHEVLDDLINVVLNVEALDTDLYRGQSRNLGGKSVFGGQVIGQALQAASRTVDGMLAHSLHNYFLRPGDMDAPIIYQVERLRDGRSFAAREVKAIQHGCPIGVIMVSFQRVEEGLEHQVQMPDVPGPDELPDSLTLRKQWLDEVPEKLKKGFMRQTAFEFRPVNPRHPFRPEKRPAEQYQWLRVHNPIAVDQNLHRSVLAYGSDFNLLGTALFPHGKSWFHRDMSCASLDHSIWFYRQVQVDEWLLYAMDSPVAGQARGLSRGCFFNQQGQLVAATTQESLMRKR